MAIDPAVEHYLTPDARTARPATTIEDALSESGSTGSWWVLHTKPRHEKAVTRALDAFRVLYFLPLVSVQHRRLGRVRHARVPLFPGYVFLCGEWQDRELALKTNRVANVLEVRNQEGLKADLRQIKHLVDTNYPVDLFPALRTGSRCRVKSGPLRGIEGVVLRRRGPWRVYIAVDFIAQSAEIEIDPMLLEVITRSR